MKEGAVVIFENPEEEYLLYLRDNKPEIEYPNTWALIGGFIECGETPEETIVREVLEEIRYKDGANYHLQNYRFLFTGPGSEIVRAEHVFYAPITETIDNLVLCEGQRFGLFDKDKIGESDDIVARHKESLLRYIQSKS